MTTPFFSRTISPYSAFYLIIEVVRLSFGNCQTIPLYFLRSVHLHRISTHLNSHIIVYLLSDFRGNRGGGRDHNKQEHSQGNFNDSDNSPQFSNG